MNNNKYKAGQIWYMKRDFKTLSENEPVEIESVIKKGRKTIVNVYDVNRNLVKGVPAKTKLRRKHK